MWEIFLELIVMVDAVQERDYNSDALGIVLLEFILFHIYGAKLFSLEHFGSKIDIMLDINMMLLF